MHHQITQMPHEIYEIIHCISCDQYIINTLLWIT